VHLEFIANMMQKITEEELGREMIECVETFRDLLACTPVDELEVHEHPRVISEWPRIRGWKRLFVTWLRREKRAASKLG
jgi:hypothetical protein